MTVRRRIMIVDDMEDIRQILSMTLSTEYEVIEARDGLQALEMIADTEPDLVIMDVAMPRLDGFDTTARIRKMPQFAKLDVMFLTSATDRDAMLKGYKSGASLYLTKPFEPERVLKNVALFFENTPPSAQPKQYKYAKLLNLLKERAANKTAAPPQPAAQKPAPAPAVPEAETALADEQKKKLDDAVTQARLAQQKMDFSKRPGTTEKTNPRLMSIGGEPKKSNPKFRLLIVDADAQNFNMARGTLALKVEVVFASSVDEALDLMNRVEPDILLLDADTKELDYRWLLGRGREIPHLRNAPVLLAMKKADNREREQAMELGVMEVIGRPYEEKELRNVIEDLMLTPSFKPAEKRLSYEQIKGA